MLEIASLMMAKLKPDPITLEFVQCFLCKGLYSHVSLAVASTGVTVFTHKPCFAIMFEPATYNSLHPNF